MKKMLSILCVAGLALTLLAGCGNSSSSSSAASSEDTSAVSSEAAGSEAASSEAASSEDSAAAQEADTEKLSAIVSAIEAVNEVPNSIPLEEFALENDLGLTMDNILGWAGDVTNNQADCALVLAVQAKSGMADAVKTELEAYKEAISSNLYAEFADKVAKAQDSRIVVSGDYVVMVIAGVDGPDYSEIDSAIESALA
ncbi:DUF4358 domain-containing protein [uncultured Subdoligranulum sp.]|mgnify:FL=1|uniref:DUF4358 domain-containing protein n=1 Tax=uncultured Subdoligranulum sp. TaxID=512298 RepID=UPI0025CDF8E7|nr:DUF4358 domain-containing protein [uncultured Subdoligranulum sp.]